MRAALGVIRKEGTLAAAVLVTAAAIRALGLDAQPLWWDEGWSVYFASLPVAEMADAASDIHPLYYLVSPGRAYSVHLRPRGAIGGCRVGDHLGRMAPEWRLLGPTAGLVTALLRPCLPSGPSTQEVRMPPGHGPGVLSWYALRSEDERAAAVRRGAVGLTGGLRGRHGPGALHRATPPAVAGSAAYARIAPSGTVCRPEVRLALLAGPRCCSCLGWSSPCPVSWRTCPEAGHRGLPC